MAGSVRADLVVMLNKALEDEHKARIQYLSHAELIKGKNAETIAARLREIASDEEKHENTFRKLIGAYLNGQPAVTTSEPGKAVRGFTDIIDINLADERQAVRDYRRIRAMIKANESEFPYEFETLEHQVKLIIIDEQEHIAELSALVEA